MAQSDLQRIAADLVAYYNQVASEVAVLVEIHNATTRNANLLGVLSHRATGNTRAYVSAAAVELAEASKAVRRAAEQFEDSQTIALEWARQAVLDTPARSAPPHEPSTAARRSPDEPQSSRPQFEPLLPGLDRDDQLVEEVAKLARPEQERWQKVFATYPGRDASDSDKAAWYQMAAAGANVPDHMRTILRGKAFHHDVADQFRATEVTIHQRDNEGNVLRTFRVDGLNRRQVVSLKNTQLADVKLATAKGHVDELVKKYKPDQPNLVIARTDGNRTKLQHWNPDAIDLPLRGQMILGVPVQSKPVPQEIIDYAADRNVIIREYTPRTSGRADR